MAAVPTAGGKGKTTKARKLSGLTLVDGLASKPACTIQDYVAAASEYVCASASLSDSQKKTGQIRLSGGLAVALRNDLLKHRADLKIRVGEHPVSGALRVVNADLSEFNELDGLRLAVEIKPVNLAVGRAIWNRFGDIRTFAVNLHLKFPFAIVGGVLTFPTYEVGKNGTRKSTLHLIERAVARLMRAGGRRTEGDAPHLLEAIGVIVYDPDKAIIHPTLPPKDSGLRWDDFVKGLALAYDARFEGQAEAVKAAEGEDEGGGGGDDSGPSGGGGGTLPLPLPESPKGASDAVLDPFAGSGASLQGILSSPRLAALRGAESIDAVLTSPPYQSLRAEDHQRALDAWCDAYLSQGMRSMRMLRKGERWVLALRNP